MGTTSTISTILKQRNIMGTTETPKKKQAKSTSYALTAFKEHVKTIEEAKLFNENDANTLREIHKRAVEKYTKDTFGY